MNKNKVVKFLIPVVAVVVILESVLLLTNVSQQSETQSKITEGNEPTSQQTKVEPTMAPAVMDMVFSTKTTQMTVGKSYTVSLALMSKKAINVDALDLYVSYDPSAFDVSNLSYDTTKLPKPTFSKVSTQKNLLVENFLVTEATGVAFTQGEAVDVMTFTVKPKKAGSFDFKVNTGKESSESATMIVENGTVSVLPFSNSPLSVSVSTQ